LQRDLKIGKDINANIIIIIIVIIIIIIIIIIINVIYIIRIITSQFLYRCA